MAIAKEQKQYLEQFWNEIEQAGEELRKVPLAELKMKDFDLFFSTGNRLVYEKAYFGRRKYLTVFGILAAYGKKPQYFEMLNKIITAVCKEQFWALPAHVNGKTRDELTIDLFAAETAQTLSEMVFMLGDNLPSETVERVYAEINRRVLIPFTESEVPYSWWEHDRCNWSAVCAGSIGMTAIYMNRLGQLADEKKDACIQRVCDALDCYLEGMEEDGACTEGLGYYSYGMSYYTAFAELLEQETKGMVNLMKKPKCENIAAFQQKCYFGGGVSVSFSDGSSKEPFLPGLTAYLAHCFPQVETPDFKLARDLEGDACYRWLTNERNIRWLLEYGRDASAAQGTKKEELTCDLLPSAQWMICKNTAGNGFAAKGGHNDENHNHNDIGHFLCVYDGEMLLTDLGAGEYTKDYFSDGRYGILCNRSMGHSVPLINGQEQKNGRDYQASAFAWDEENKELTISFAEAYPKDCVEKLTRRIQVTDAKTCALQIRDCFEPSGQTKEIVEQLVTQYETEVEENRIFIKGSHGTCCIQVNGIEENSRIHITEHEHSNHAGKKEKVYVICWNLPILQNEESRCTMCITYNK